MMEKILKEENLFKRQLGFTDDNRGKFGSNT